MEQITTQGYTTFESVRICKDGTAIPIEVSVRPIELGGQPMFLGISRDITERKKQERELQKLNLALNLVKESIFMGDENGRFQYVNDEACRVLGYSREELLGGMGIPDIAPADWTNEKWKEHWQEIRNRGSVSFEDYQRTRDGRMIPVEVNANYFEYDGRGFYMGLVRDITERKNAEYDLSQAAEQLQHLMTEYELLRASERMSIAREVHDELGQTLSALRLEISKIRIQFGRGNPELMAMVQNAIDLVDNAIHDVRNVSENLRPAVLEMGIVSAIEWLATDFAAKTGIPCSLDLPHQNVKLEEKRAMVVFRIVQESLTNVIRHAHATGVRIALAQGNDELCVEIRDNGRGFAGNAPKKQRSLGLLGMKERARALQGSLEIASAAGEGTAVSLRIPLGPVADK